MCRTKKNVKNKKDLVLLKILPFFTGGCVRGFEMKKQYQYTCIEHEYQGREWVALMIEPVCANVSTVGHFNPIPMAIQLTNNGRGLFGWVVSIRNEQRWRFRKVIVVDPQWEHGYKHPPPRTIQIFRSATNEGMLPGLVKPLSHLLSQQVSITNLVLEYFCGPYAVSYPVEPCAFVYVK